MIRYPLLLLLLCPVVAAGAVPRESVAFEHATVIDGTGGEPKKDQTVVIVDGKITFVGPAESEVPTGARRIDATGRYLIPGLWDMHVHVLWEPAVDTLLPLMVANGVTGCRDMHTHFSFEKIRAWVADVETGRRVGPRIVYAGPILDGPEPIWPGSIAVSDAESGRKAVRDLKAAGVHFIKVYERLPREAYFAIADEAKKQGIPFAGHVPEAVTPAEASDAGQHSIEHLSHFYEHCRKPAESGGGFEYDPAKGAALFEKFKRNHTWQCPTLIVAETSTFGREDRVAKDPRRRYLAPDILSKVGFDDSKRDWDATLAFWRQERRLVRHLHEAGVEVMAGTDAPIVRNIPGFSLHDELKCLVDAGLTPMQALQAATLNPARFLGREKELGTVEAAKRADLVLLDADPLADIRNVTRISAVVADGRLYDRAALDKLLADIEAAAAPRSP